MAASNESAVNCLSSRPVVLWYGPGLPAADAVEFDRRGLLIESAPENIEQKLPSARALSSLSKVFQLSRRSPFSGGGAAVRWITG